MEIKLSFNIANKEFTKNEPQKLTVTTSEITEDCNNIIYSLKIPRYLYNAVVDKAPWYMQKGISRNQKYYNNRDQSYPPFKTIISALTIHEIRQKIEEINDYAMTRATMNRAPDDKVICIKFNAITKSCRTAYNHADAGEQTNISFQYFVAYKFVTDEHSLFPGRINYYSRIRNTPAFSTTSQRNTIGIEVNQQFFHHVPNSSKGFEEEYTIIKWTEEREQFFSTIQTKFKNLAEDLSKFLKDLDENKVAALIANFNLLQIEKL